jgi:hypothetical protein
MPRPGPRDRDRAGERRVDPDRRVVARLVEVRDRVWLDERAEGLAVRDELRVPPLEAARGRDAVLVATPEL